MTITTLSENEFLKVKKEVDKITSRLADSKKNYGLWQDRQSRQFQATQYAESQNYYERLNEINAILNNSTNVERWKREAQDEEKRLTKIQEDKERKEKYLLDFEEKRLKVALDLKLKEDEKIRLEEKRLSDLLIQSDELESFYDFDVMAENNKLPKEDQRTFSPMIDDSIESIESIESIDSMPKQIPLETVTPVLAVLGIGLVSYYLLKGNKK